MSSFKDLPPRDPIAIVRPPIELRETAGSFPHRDVISREPESQISIRGKVVDLEAFKSLCREERRTYGDMLSILVRAYRESQR